MADADAAAKEYTASPDYPIVRDELVSDRDFSKILPLLEKLRKKGEAALCPQCSKPLVAETRSGVAMMACPDKHGAWLRAEVLEALFQRLK